jgi:hypothetical protein
MSPARDHADCLTVRVMRDRRPPACAWSEACIREPGWDLDLPMLLPGVKINTSPDNYFLIRQMQLARVNGEIWERFGELISG